MPSPPHDTDSAATGSDRSGALPPIRWTTWLLLVLFIFLAFEFTLLAVAFKGSWFILLAPGIVCGVKALETWRDIQRRAR